MAGFSLSGVRTLHRTAFDYSAKGLTLRASAEALFNAAPAPAVRVRAPLFREPSLWLGFCFSGTGLSIELRSIIRPRASPCGPALKRCSTRRQRRLSESGHHYLENPAYGWVFAFQGLDSPSNCVRLFGLKTSPCGPALKRCSTRRQRAT